MNKASGVYLAKTNLLLFMLGNVLCSRFLYWYAVPQLMEQVRQNPTEGIPLMIAALVSSRRPRLSKAILFALAGLPEETLESNLPLRELFLRGQTKANSLKEAIQSCQTALTICFAAK